jgi:hypothetical protein
MARGRPSAAAKQREQLDRIMDRHANGEPLVDICVGEGIAPSEFRGWMRRDPELKLAWREAEAEYVHSIFDEMASITKQLATGRFTKDDGARVQALRAALDGLKHVTSRLNPAQYGEQKAGQQGVTVVINTTLPIGEGQAPAAAIDGDFKVVVALPEPGSG